MTIAYLEMLIEARSELEGPTPEMWFGLRWHSMRHASMPRHWVCGWRRFYNAFGSLEVASAAGGNGLSGCSWPPVKVARSIALAV